ncbi:MAG: 3'(2'),5'-bisphosphate nucleotidase CysQ [Rhodobacterales bacterium]|nr:MAG: 3'(2'),5'-bisphosphate nucleotidase CysQ [Rhodobacterales bacterium]
MPDANPDLDLLIEAAHASGEIAGKYWRRSPQSWEKSAGAGPVTEADLAIDQMLRHELCTARPDYGWLSEETEDDPARLAHDQLFIIDPIDGTRAFIAGAETFAHSLAIARAGRITEAVVFLPMLDKLYSASRDQVALLNGQEIGPATPAQGQTPTILAAKCNLEPRHWHGQPAPFARHYRRSLAYRMCLVAEGRFDAMLTLRPTFEWDVAAGALIAQQAGVHVSDRSGKALNFNNRKAQLDGIMAASAPVHKAICDRLNPG